MGTGSVGNSVFFFFFFLLNFGRGREGEGKDTGGGGGGERGRTREPKVSLFIQCSKGWASKTSLQKSRVLIIETTCLK